MSKPDAIPWLADRAIDETASFLVRTSQVREEWSSGCVPCNKIGKLPWIFYERKLIRETIKQFGGTDLLHKSLLSLSKDSREIVVRNISEL